jgi:hypothetical protein
MDKFNFFQHFRWKFSTGSKFSDYIPFTQDGNPRRFEVFRLYSLYTGWKLSTGSKFSDNIPFTQDGNPRRFEVFRLYSLYTGWKSSTFRSFPIIFPLHRMEILDVSKFSDYITIAKDGNRRLFEDFRLNSLFKGWKYPTIRRFLLIFPIKGRKSLNFTAKILICTY